MNTEKQKLRKVSSLYGEIRTILENTRQSACRAVNFAMVQAYWRVGCFIVESEQEGKEEDGGQSLNSELNFDPVPLMTKPKPA